ncbi:MAG: energy transducer TonB [Melioribacteraceae bacterium]|nr:energy transducer TonB [Melioribacteraceae bacterium]
MKSIIKTMLSSIILLLFTLQMNTLFAQEKPGKTPFPVGGIKSIMKNIKYPVEAKKQGIEGKVVLKAVVDENGKVIKTEVLESNDGLLSKAAADAIMKTRFEPAEKDGKKVKADVTIPVMFKLDGVKKKKE